jgi:hypothetical protein
MCTCPPRPQCHCPPRESTCIAAGESVHKQHPYHGNTISGNHMYHLCSCSTSQGSARGGLHLIHACKLCADHFALILLTVHMPTPLRVYVPHTHPSCLESSAVTSTYAPPATLSVAHMLHRSHCGSLAHMPHRAHSCMHVNCPNFFTGLTAKLWRALLGVLSLCMYMSRCPMPFLIAQDGNTAKLQPPKEAVC